LIGDSLVTTFLVSGIGTPIVANEAFSMICLVRSQRENARSAFDLGPLTGCSDTGTDSSSVTFSLNIQEHAMPITALKRDEGQSSNLFDETKLNAFAKELSQLSHKYGIGITGDATLFVLEPVDYQLSYYVEDSSKLSLK
jgi:hypothetical protein